VGILAILGWERKTGGNLSGKPTIMVCAQNYFERKGVTPILQATVQHDRKIFVQYSRMTVDC